MTKKEESKKTRYSDEELEEFRQIIKDKLEKATNDLELLTEAVARFLKGANRLAMDPDTTVLPGENYTFKLDLTVPAVPGKYGLRTRMLKEDVLYNELILIFNEAAYSLYCVYLSSYHNKHKNTYNKRRRKN